MKIRHKCASFYCYLQLSRVIFVLVGFYLQFSANHDVGYASKWTLKPGQDLDSVLNRYEKVVLNPIDETTIYQTASEELAAYERRSSKGGKLPTHLEISVFGRNLSLFLHRGESAFTADAKIIVHGFTAAETVKMEAKDMHSSVEGFVLGEPRSSVRGLVSDGVFFGTVSSQNWTYYVQPASHYFLNASNSDAIVYRDSDLKTYKYGLEQDSRTAGGGAGRESTPSRVNLESDSKTYKGVSDSNWNTFELSLNRDSKTSRVDLASDPNFSIHSQGSKNDAKQQWMSTLCGNSSDSSKNCKRGFVSRRPVLAQPAKNPNVKRVCKVIVVADHYFFIEYSSSKFQLAVALMEYYVKEADKMFRETDFDSDNKFDDVRIQMARVEVYRSAQDERYEMADHRFQSSEYLNAFSKYNYGNYCAAVAFSHREFRDGTLGISFRSEDDGKRKQGICSPYISRGSEGSSSNTAFVTFNKHGTTQPGARCAVLLTHHLGHLFGSLVDEEFSETICQPKEPALMYIMAAAINEGTTEANRDFSPCSISRINRMMKENGNCLDHYKDPGCNGVGVPYSFLSIFFVSSLFAHNLFRNVL